MSQNEVIDKRKPQSPLTFKGIPFYPITTYDQIIMKDGSRWDGTSSDTSQSGILVANHDNEGNVTLSII
jgi:hypothetical protein